jgi:hypothetical protein
MPKTRTLQDLNEMLFKAAERLEGASGEALDAELLRAKATGEICKVLIDSGKLELATLKAGGEKDIAGGRFLLTSRTAAKVEEESNGPRALPTVAAGRRQA